mmetsp:Transcript_2759/g.3924  ORF Transcript_2759/g.3924 Transcript_2759/m.3924 type:complete len:358 (-) Transcript_2759:74-1147(-)
MEEKSESHHNSSNTIEIEESSLICSVDYKVDSLALFSPVQDDFPQLLAIGGSKMEGNNWNGGLHVLKNKIEGDESSWEVFQRAYLRSGVTSVGWVEAQQQTEPLVLAAQDSGDAVVYKLELTGDANDCFCRPTELKEFSEHDDLISKLDIQGSSGASERFVTASWDASIKLWDLQAETQSSLQTIIGHATIVTDVKWSPADKDVFASTSKDQTVRIWDARSGVEACRWGVACAGLSLSWHPTQPASLVAGCEDGNIVVLDLRKLTEVISVEELHQGCVYALNYSCDGRLLASASDACSLVINSTEEASQNNLRKSVSNLHSDYIRAACWQKRDSGAKKSVLTAGWDGTIKSSKIICT